MSTPNERKEFCSGCTFWQADPSGGGQPGRCRHDPPTVFMAMAQAPGAGRIASLERQNTMSAQPFFLSAWPPTNADGWCGKWTALDGGVK